MTERTPNFDSWNSYDKNKISSSTYETRKKEKEEADSVLKRNLELDKQRKGIESLRKSHEKELKKFSDEKINLEKSIAELSTSINSLGKGNENAKKTLEENKKQKQLRLNFVKSQVDFYTKKINENKTTYDKIDREVGITYKQYQKEKAEFDAAHKKALEEFKKSLEVEKAQQLYNKTKQEIANIETQIKSTEYTINTSNKNLLEKKENLKKLNEKINKVYEDFKTEGITLDKSGRISDNDIARYKSLKATNSKSSKVITFFKGYDLLVEYGKQRTNIENSIKSLEGKISDGTKKVTNLKAKKITLQNENNDYLVSNKQRGIILKA